MIHSIKLFLLLLFFSADSFANSAVLYTEKELEAIDVSGVHLGINVEEANQAIAEMYAIEAEHVKRTVARPYPEFLLNNVQTLKFKSRELRNSIDISFDIDLDRKETGYLAASVIHYRPSSSAGAEETQKVVDETILRAIEQIGPATFEEETQGYKTYFWCSKFNKNQDGCDNESASAKMNYSVFLRNPNYNNKFNTYLEEKKSRKTAKGLTLDEHNSITFDKLVAALSPIHPVYNDDSIAADTKTNVYDDRKGFFVNSSPCAETPEFPVELSIYQKGVPASGRSQISRGIYIHEEEINTVALFSTLKNTQIGCRRKVIGGNHVSVTSVKPWDFQGLDAITIVTEPLKKNKGRKETNHWLRKDNIVVVVKLIESNTDAIPLLDDAISAIDSALTD